MYQLFHIEYTKLKNLLNTYNKKNRLDFSIGEYYITKISKSLNKLGVSENNLCYQSNFDKRMSDCSYSDFELDNKSTKSDPDGSNMKESKRKTMIYSDAHQLVNEIFNNFIDDNAKYEINIPGRIKKEIRSNLYEHNQRFNRGNFKIIDEKVDVDDIFDEAYEVILQDLFLNVYTGYISNRNKNKTKGNKNNSTAN